MISYERTLEELSPEERGRVKAEMEKIKPDIKFVATWEDDHCMCVGVEIAGVQAGFWWLTDKAAAAFQFPDSPTALKIVRAVVHDSLPLKLPPLTRKNLRRAPKPPKGSDHHG